MRVQMTAAPSRQMLHLPQVSPGIQYQGRKLRPRSVQGYLCEVALEPWIRTDPCVTPGKQAQRVRINETRSWVDGAPGPEQILNISFHQRGYTTEQISQHLWAHQQVPYHSLK